MTSENRIITEKKHQQDCLIAFKQQYPLPFQVHLIVTPPRYAVNGSIDKATDCDTTGYTPYFPDSNGKVNLWCIRYVLNPLECYLQWDNPKIKLYGLSVIVPKQLNKPQHAHIALCSASGCINAETVTTAIESLELNRHSQNNDDQFSYTGTTVLCQDIAPGTVPYIITENLYESNVVSTLHLFNKNLFPNI